MRTLALQTVPLEGLEELGVCELREQGWWHTRALVQEAIQAGQEAELVLLGVTLFVDGEPIGREVLPSLPGRLTAALSEALGKCLALYYVKPRPVAPDAAVEDSPPGEP